MRILHLITDLKLGGESRNLLASIKELAEFEHLVACMSVNLDADTSPRDVSEGLETMGIGLIDLGARRGRPRTFANAALQFAQVISEKQPDLLHSSLVHANLLALAVTPPRIPVIATIVSVEPWTATWQPLTHRLLTRRAKVVLANSPRVVHALAASGVDATRIRCLPYGVDARRFTAEGERAQLGEGPVIVGVGALIDLKGFSDLIAAAATMPAKPRVVLVGQGPLASDLKQQAAHLDVDLVITGGVEDVVPYLRRADVVAIPSWWEGVPNVLLEALAVGRPVVATSVGGIPDVVQDDEHALLVPAGQPPALARALERALTQEAQDIARRGQEMVLERHGWSRYIEKRRLLYECLTARRTVPRRPKSLRRQPSQNRRPHSAEMSPRSGQEPGLVLVVPKAGSEVSEHFAHTFRFAQHLRRHIRTAVIVERLVGDQPPAHPAVEVFVQRHVDGNVLFRALELIVLAARLHRKGFDSFFVRTSQTAAVPLIFLCRLFGGRVMYWNCGKAPKNRLRHLGLRTTFRSEFPARFAFRWADTVVTGTESLAAHYSRTFGIPRHRISVLPNEIDLEWFKPATKKERSEARAELDVVEDESLVLSVHRFSPVRRTLLYIPEVLEEVLERHARVRFVLAGGGPEENEVRRAVARAGLDDRVRLLGKVPHDHIRRLYAAADIFMMPSYTEGFPRVLLEAMALGVPIASTDVGGIREILPGSYHPHLANRDRPIELAHAVDKLLRDPALAQQLASEGLSWVRRFDAPSVARQLAALACA